MNSILTIREERNIFLACDSFAGFASSRNMSLVYIIHTIFLLKIGSTHRKTRILNKINLKRTVIKDKERRRKVGIWWKILMSTLFANITFGGFKIRKNNLFLSRSSVLRKRGTARAFCRRGRVCNCVHACAIVRTHCDGQVPKCHANMRWIVMSCVFREISIPLLCQFSGHEKRKVVKWS